jgi:hypothetical protein
VLSEWVSGERGRNRTFNLLIKSQLLCQLSYAPFAREGKRRASEEDIISVTQALFRVSSQQPGRTGCSAAVSIAR